MTVADSLITLLAPEIGEERAKYLLLDFIKVSTINRSSRAAYRAEVLCEAATLAGELAEQFSGSGGEMAADREWGAAQAAQALFDLASDSDGGAR